jgi:hypothetical protein
MAAGWLDEHRQIWAERFDKLDRHMRDIQQGNDRHGARTREAAMGDDEQAERLGDGAELLGEMKQLRRQARTARHACWFPLAALLVGLLATLLPALVLLAAGAGAFAVQRRHRKAA